MALLQLLQRNVRNLRACGKLFRNIRNYFAELWRKKGKKKEEQKKSEKYGTPHRFNFIFVSALGKFYVIYIHIS